MTSKGNPCGWIVVIANNESLFAALLSCARHSDKSLLCIMRPSSHRSRVSVTITVSCTLVRKLRHREVM